MSYTPIELSRRAAALMAERGLENPRLEAELLLAHALGLQRLDLYLQHDRPLTEVEVETFRGLVRRRLSREPIQYITGEAAFRELTLAVDRRVLIPRPETEILVGEVLDWAHGRAWPRVPDAGGAGGAAQSGSGGRGAREIGRGRHALRALDIGTGCGAIALSLAKEGPFEVVVATDVSADALSLAAENARRAGVADRVEFRRGPYFGPVEAGECFDVVVSNPPYIADSELAELPAEVRDWEPGAALFGGPDGLTVIRKLVADAGAYLAAGGLLALELGADQSARVAAEVAATHDYGRARRVRDLAGRERIVLAERLGRVAGGAAG